MRVICYTQSLSGVGHFVCAHLVACGLAEGHEVHLVDGGRPVPRPRRAREPRRLRLPRLERGPDGAVQGEGGAPAGEVFARRRAVLSEAAARLRADVVVVEHFPFSKWELQDEILGLLAAARATNPAVKVVASLRDLAPRGRFDDRHDRSYADTVLRLLDDHFDLLLVHGDPGIADLADGFPDADRIPVPVEHTGYLCDPVPDPPSSAGATRSWAVLSSGGLGATGLAIAGIDAFARLGRGRLDALHVFAGLGTASAELDELHRAAHGRPVEVHPFGPDFDGWLHGAGLAIGRVGYNTSAALLRSRVRSVLAPDPSMADQVARAPRLADLGLGVCVDGPRQSDPDAIADAMARAAALPEPVHDVSLAGVPRTRRAIEDLVAG